MDGWTILEHMCDTTRVDAATVAGWVRALATLHTGDTGGGDAERIDQLRALEELKAACAAAQATVTVAFADSQHATQAAAGLPARERGRGVGAQVALAGRDHPGKGGRHLGLATALVRELPRTLAALRAGLISEWRATLIARETACLSAEHRRQVDAELADQLGSLGDKATAVAARRAAYRLDPAAALDRASKAESERRVTLRPAPDTMTVLTALLPMKQGVACYAALKRHADTRTAGGDARTRGQLMADTLVERVTGQATADQVPVEVTLLVTDHTLFAGGDQPAHLDGYGPVPAPLARRLLHPDTEQADAEHTDDGAAGQAKVWLRRLYTHPGTGKLVGLESRHRLFPPGLRRFLVYRDQFCRTPWCGAPIRHADHVVPASRGGPTSAGNGQGLFQACNQTQQLPGWTALPDPRDGTVQTTTPTGHTYTSHPPPPVGDPLPPTESESRLEQRLRDLIEAAA